MRLDDFDEVPVIIQILQRPVEQRFGIADHSGQRRSQFMRHVCNEVLANLL